MNFRVSRSVLIASAVSALILFSVSTACHGKAEPLRALVGPAELIVLADVGHVAESPAAGPQGRPRMPPGTDLIAHLIVRETFKGEPLATVDVAFNDHEKWPAPPRYVAGDTVMAFLRRNGQLWTTVGMADGAIVVTEHQLQDVREALVQALELQRQGPVPSERRLAGQGDALAGPGTPDKCLSSLVPEGAAHGAVIPLHGDPARPQPLELIAERFVNDPPTDENLPRTLRLLSGYPSAEVDRAAIDSFEAVLARPSPPSWTRDALVLLLARLHLPDAESRLSGLHRIATRAELQRARGIWRNVRRQLVLAPERFAAEPTPVSASGEAPLLQ